MIRVAFQGGGLVTALQIITLVTYLIGYWLFVRVTAHTQQLVLARLHDHLHVESLLPDAARGARAPAIRSEPQESKRHSTSPTRHPSHRVEATRWR